MVPSGASQRDDTQINNNADNISVTAVAAPAKPGLARPKDEHPQAMPAARENDTLISQSMQLSDDEDEEMPAGDNGQHETSISYLTKDNMQACSNKKFSSNFTRKTT